MSKTLLALVRDYSTNLIYHDSRTYLPFPRLMVLSHSIAWWCYLKSLTVVALGFAQVFS